MVTLLLKVATLTKDLVITASAAIPMGSQPSGATHLTLVRGGNIASLHSLVMRNWLVPKTQDIVAVKRKQYLARLARNGPANLHKSTQGPQTDTKAKDSGITTIAGILMATKASGATRLTRINVGTTVHLHQCRRRQRLPHPLQTHLLMILWLFVRRCATNLGLAEASMSPSLELVFFGDRQNASTRVIQTEIATQRSKMLLHLLVAQAKIKSQPRAAVEFVVEKISSFSRNCPP
mmetsp:Transcript_78128/g.142082  ORF Transcript_78128/g.142082 Transcript_78128/m.142082 type:complete len:235 (+) Transcript_78128:363-1067(+)